MLKIIASLLMTLDHIGYIFSDRLPEGWVFPLRLIGRLAFPMFAWSVGRGYARTRNPARYFFRLLLFAGLAEMIIRGAFRLGGLRVSGTNVLFTFALGVCLITAYRLIFRTSLDVVGGLRPVLPGAGAGDDPRYHVRLNPLGIELSTPLGIALGWLLALAVLALTWLLSPDYSFFGVFAVLLFYIVFDRVPEELRARRDLQAFILLNAVFLPIRILLWGGDSSWAIVQTFGVLALPICHAFNREKRPSQAAKYFFYFYYPLHLLLLCLLRRAIISGF